MDWIFQPILGSDPIAFEISSMSASVSSHKAVIELMEETRCARYAFATNCNGQVSVNILLN